MGMHVRAATEQQVELLKKTWDLPQNTPISPPQTNRHRKTKVGNLLEILENHQ